MTRRARTLAPEPREDSTRPAPTPRPIRAPVNLLPFGLALAKPPARALALVTMRRNFLAGAAPVEPIWPRSGSNSFSRAIETTAVSLRENDPSAYRLRSYRELIFGCAHAYLDLSHENSMCRPSLARARGRELLSCPR